MHLSLALLGRWPASCQKIDEKSVLLNDCNAYDDVFSSSIRSSEALLDAVYRGLVFKMFKDAGFKTYLHWFCQENEPEYDTILQLQEFVDVSNKFNNIPDITSATRNVHNESENTFVCIIIASQPAVGILGENETNKTALAANSLIAQTLASRAAQNDLKLLRPRKESDSNVFAATAYHGLEFRNQIWRGCSASFALISKEWEGRNSLMTPVGVSAALLTIANIPLGKIPPPICNPPSCISIYEDDNGVSKCVVRVLHSNVRCDVFRTIDPPCQMSVLPDYFTSFELLGTEGPDSGFRIRDSAGLIDNMLNDQQWCSRNGNDLLDTVSKIVKDMVIRREKEAKQTKIVPVHIEPVIEPVIVPESPKPESPKPESPKPESPKPESQKPESPKPEIVQIEEKIEDTPVIQNNDQKNWKLIVEEALKLTFDSDGVALSQIHLNNMVENNPYTLFYAKDKVICLQGCVCPSLMKHFTKHNNNSLPLINGKSVRVGGSVNKPRIAHVKVNLDSYIQAATVSIYKSDGVTNDSHTYTRSRPTRGSVLRYTRQMEIQRLKR